MTRLFVLLLLSGCVGGIWVPDGYFFTIPMEGFQDIPIPPFEYTEVPGKTFAYVCPTDPHIRIARIVLVGEARLDDTVRFFERELPVQGFIPLRKPLKSRVLERVQLFYKKRGRDEYLSVDIQRDEKIVEVEIRLTTYPPG